VIYVVFLFVFNPVFMTSDCFYQIIALLLFNCADDFCMFVQLCCNNTDLTSYVTCSHFTIIAEFTF